jgi:hypothetical protein
MWELSYWLFPLVALVYFFFPGSEHFLFPGLLAACVAGAANSAVLDRYGFMAGHALAAALLLLVARKKVPSEPGAAARVGALLTWAVLALAVTYALPKDAWPYELTKTQMAALFVAFLPLGACATL